MGPTQQWPTLYCAQRRVRDGGHAGLSPAESSLGTSTVSPPCPTGAGHHCPRAVLLLPSVSYNGIPRPCAWPAVTLSGTISSPCWQFVCLGGCKLQSIDCKPEHLRGPTDVPFEVARLSLLFPDQSCCQDGLFGMK